MKPKRRKAGVLASGEVVYPYRHEHVHKSVCREQIRQVLKTIDTGNYPSDQRLVRVTHDFKRVVGQSNVVPYDPSKPAGIFWAIRTGHHRQIGFFGNYDKFIVNKKPIPTPLLTVVLYRRDEKWELLTSYYAVSYKDSEMNYKRGEFWDHHAFVAEREPFIPNTEITFDPRRDEIMPKVRIVRDSNANRWAS